MEQFWNDRYAAEEYVYGEQPNLFLKTQLDKLSTGAILFPAEGEGRNAVYAASKGWKVFAFDQSVQGQKKALLLAEKNNVAIDYIVNAFKNLPYRPNQFDAMALIYAHFPADKKSEFHKMLTKFLKPGAIIIFEAYSKKHLEYSSKNEKSGGPRDVNMLFSMEEIKSDFSDFDMILLREENDHIEEGIYHSGISSVIRYVGRKK